MELKPGYKNTEGWNIVRLGDFAIFLRNKPLSRAQLSSSGDIHCLHYGDIHNAKDSIISANELPYLIDTEIKNVDFLETGDIIFVDASEDMDGVGKSVEICKSPGEKIIAGLHTIPIRFSNEILINGFKRYLQYIPSFIHHIKCLASGLKVFSTQKMHISDAMVVLPPPAEQTAIAAALSDVDALLSSVDALIAKKRDMKQAAMQELLTGRRRLPQFNGKWQTIRLGEYATFLRNKAFSRSQLSSSGEIHCLHYGDIHNSNETIINAEEMPYITATELKNLDFLTDGDLVFVDASEDLDGVGKSVEITHSSKEKLISGLHTIPVRFSKEILADGFKRYLQFIPSFILHVKRLASGLKVFSTQKSHIAEAAVTLPSPAEQTAIAAVLSDMDAEIAALEARRAKTQALKQGMMQDLLTGRIRLRPAEGESHA